MKKYILYVVAIVLLNSFTVFAKADAIRCPNCGNRSYAMTEKYAYLVSKKHHAKEYWYLCKSCGYSGKCGSGETEDHTWSKSYKKNGVKIHKCLECNCLQRDKDDSVSGNIFNNIRKTKQEKEKNYEYTNPYYSKVFEPQLNIQESKKVETGDKILLRVNNTNKKVKWEIYGRSKASIIAKDSDSIYVKIKGTEGRIRIRAYISDHLIGELTLKILPSADHYVPTSYEVMGIQPTDADSNKDNSN